MPPSFSPISSHSPACKPAINFDSKRSYMVGDRASTTDGAGGAVERGEKAIPGVVDLPTTESRKLATHYRMMFVK